MKKVLIFSLLAVCISLNQCTKDICRQAVTYTRATAIYGDLNELRQPIKNTVGVPIENPGKILVQDQYMFITEEDRGFHVIANHDLSNPVSINFVAVPGINELTISENTLIVDSYYDILLLDISQPTNISLISRNENVFPQRIFDDAGNPLIGFKYQQITEKLDCGSLLFNEIHNHDVVFMSWDNSLIPASTVPTAFSGGVASGPNVSGTLNRMLVADQHLYLINQQDLLVFDIVGDHIEPATNWTIDRTIETLFKTGNHLFIGSANGMYIYDINNGQPEAISAFFHENACDPVLPTDAFAYVTLRTGNTCEGTINRLEVVSLENIERPQIASSVEMENPHGMALKDTHLFVCEGIHGIKVFDVTNPQTLNMNNLLFSEAQIEAYDITFHPNDENVLIIVGDNEINQYRLEANSSLSLIGSLRM